MAENQTLICSCCSRSEIVIDGTVLIFGSGRFPVFAATCKSCGEIACLDCAPSRSVPESFLDFVVTRPAAAQFHAFSCPGCQAAFPSADFPVRFFVFEHYLNHVAVDAVTSFGAPAKLVQLYGYDISHVEGLPAAQRHILRADGLAALLTVGVPGLMPIRCSQKR